MPRPEDRGLIARSILHMCHKWGCDPDLVVEGGRETAEKWHRDNQPGNSNDTRARAQLSQGLLTDTDTDTDARGNSVLRIGQVSHTWPRPRPRPHMHIYVCNTVADENKTYADEAELTHIQHVSQFLSYSHSIFPELPGHFENQEGQGEVGGGKKEESG